MELYRGMWCAFLITMYLAFKASASQIIGHGNRSAEYGEDAYYKCKLEDPKDVLQVTWQRVFKDNPIENLATYSKRFGEQVNDPYKGKILFTEASLHSSSITVRNLTWADESCYVCSFNAYPSGSKRHQTCLKVQGVSDVKTQVFEPSDEPENKDIQVIFSCSATGKPAPKLQWDYSKDVAVVEKSQTLVMTNVDQSLTSSTNVTLQLSPDWSGHVHCLINPGMRGEKKESITYTRIKKNTKSDVTSDTAIVIISICVILLIFAGILFLLKRLNHLPSCKQNVI
ncbi:OX-2 membrane glycoprotein-like isoform X3 [Boleophthalmus pectinirostris]|uniref:OX-2 membrane glycoprotein-like isoform X3 n=1 Tax=Boleophthalmus pectinirostris TaxID=150288 RepID=UPI0024325A56|nr:OX-2 membrane glycoprotein-like isoform X3 [Boleophthalmus pectinirostris]